jgi:hypothetical protein
VDSQRKKVGHRKCALPFGNKVLAAFKQCFPWLFALILSILSTFKVSFACLNLIESFAISLESLYKERSQFEGAKMPSYTLFAFTFFPDELCDVL